MLITFKYLKVFLLIFIFLFISESVLSQGQHPIPSDTIHLNKGESSIIPLPIVGANPTVGVLFGVALSANAMLGDYETTRMSTSVSTVNYSIKNQLLAFIKTNIYTPGDKWILLGDWRYFDSSQPTFGLGTGPESSKLITDSIEYKDGMFTEPIDDEQLLHFKYLKLSEIVLKEVHEYVYFGVGYHLDYHFDIRDNLLSLDTANGAKPKITSHYSYSTFHGFNTETYTLSGLSMNFLFDSRDNAANPYKGRYALISYRINPVFLGSSQNSSSLWLEYRDYFSVSKSRPRNLIALWLFGDFSISGKRPYMDLGAIGWDQFGKSGRAYTQGRFRGDNLIYSEVEYRAHLWGSKKNPELFGAVAFVNATTASNTDGGIDLFQYINYAYGIGFRVMLQQEARINVTIDYAWGQYGAQGIFINANEAF